jgi:hypothetical protein
MQGDHGFHLQKAGDLVQVLTQIAVWRATPTDPMMRMQMSDRPTTEGAKDQLGSATESGSMVWVETAYSQHEIALHDFRIDLDRRTKPRLADAC